MKHSYLFLADGFEEIEALATVDVLRRAQMEVITVSINRDTVVTGAHGVAVTADATIANVDLDTDTEWLICPGGMPGASHLAADAKLTDMLVRHHAAGGKIAAICASPALVLWTAGVIDGRHFTCYPGMEPEDCGDLYTGDPVVAFDTLITGNGPASTLAFAYSIVAATKGVDVASEVAKAMMY
ncbi:MAG: DJ-1/PfpI family protein [Paramuribaculum sp.]|nr:DJ-1/PfpI family protein [Paramuribaculum sp.]